MSFSFNKRYIVSILVLFVLITTSIAQAKWEAGAKAGTTFYLGDRNSTIFNSIDPVYGGFLRINVNSRWVTKIQFTTATIKTDFKQRFLDFSVQEEFNFFEYGVLNSNKWTRFFSPYIFAGISLGTYEEGDYAIFAPNIPFGLGVKYKVFPKVNIGLEWCMHKLFTDAFDNRSNPYKNKEFGLSNKDWYSMATFILSVDIGNKSSYCR